MEEEDINFTVEISITNKVVICWVVKGDFCQRETITKVIEEVEPGKVIRIGVGSLWVLVTCILYMDLEIYE